MASAAPSLVALQSEWQTRVVTQGTFHFDSDVFSKIVDICAEAVYSPVPQLSCKRSDLPASLHTATGSLRVAAPVNRVHANEVRVLIV